MQAGVWAPPPWDREPTGKSATERAMDGLEACPKGEVPVTRRSVEVRPQSGREAGLGHSTFLLESSVHTLCKTERLRAAHPCALSRSTAHPVHKPPTNCASLKKWIPDRVRDDVALTTRDDAIVSSAAGAIDLTAMEPNLNTCSAIAGRYLSVYNCRPRGCPRVY